MQSRKLTGFAIVLSVATALLPAQAQEDQKIKWGGTVYMKWLWGNQRYDGSLYNFTTVPGEGYGDNGQGSEIELFLNARVSSQVSVHGRLHSRFNQNQWTNFGGWGGYDVFNDLNGCTGGDCGEFDSRSNQYVKLRGVAVTFTPGTRWLSTVVAGSNDFGMFDPFTIGKIRYIDRDNGSGLLFQGGNASRTLNYDFVRISLPRLWAGPNFQTGDFTAEDAAYGLQLTFTPNAVVDVAGIFEYVNDIEVNGEDLDIDDGRDIKQRFKNSVVGIRLGLHPSSMFDISARYYDSLADSNPITGVSTPNQPPTSFGLSGFSPVPAGKLEGEAWRFNLDINDPFGIGLSFNLEGFDIGEDYVSMMAARRESDVLLTEGNDGTWGLPGPSNAAFGVFAGNPTKIGYGGWQGNAQQVATINVDNEFTDFDEPLAETVIGWKGFTIAPTFARGDFNLGAEYTYVDYNTNWQAWDDITRAIDDTIYPAHELDTGVGHNFRSAYAPFQDKETDIAVLNANYLFDVGTGLEIFGKIKYIDEQDWRLNDPLFLPFAPGDCPGAPIPCGNVQNNYFGTNSTASIYGNPPVIGPGSPDPALQAIPTEGGATGYRWKPFDDISDDDRDQDYKLYSLGVGYQLTDQVYGALAYELYDVELQDGNTAFQAYQLHEMASGEHTKNKVIARARYSLAGTEFGLSLEHNWGDFEPNFGGGFVAQIADAAIAQTHNVPVGSRGFVGRFGGWNSLEKREFRHNRLKAYLKVQF